MFRAPTILKHVTVLVGVVALVSVMVLLSGPARAETLPFSDDFESGSLAKWTPQTLVGGNVTVDTTQSVSPPYALHITSLTQATDKAIACPNLSYDHNKSIMVEFDFRIAPGYHWVYIWQTWESMLVADYNEIVARDYRGVNNLVMSISPDTWYHIQLCYDASSELNTVWIDGVKKLTYLEFHFLDEVFVGDRHMEENMGEAWWDNFRIFYYLNPPEPPKPVSPVNGSSSLDAPDLVWEFMDVAIDDHQTAYHIQIADDPTFTDWIWDSGFVTDNQSVHHSPDISPGSWYWRVRVRDNESLWSNWSIPAFFIIDKRPPSWDLIPDLAAVEDVPVTFDFWNYVIDGENADGTLELECMSLFLVKAQGFNLTFEFPEGVTETNATLVLKDASGSAGTVVRFVIEPVNDPPTHSVPSEYSAVEDVPLVIDLEPYVVDPDSMVGDLSLDVDDPFVTVDGLQLTATFPEGVLDHLLVFNITDGSSSTSVRISFTVLPVDDPPVVSTPETFYAIEDNLSVLNLTSYVHDVDTPINQLRVVVDSFSCTVVSRELHFSYTTGGFDETVRIEVSDNTTTVETYLRVVVEERNDAPIVHPIAQLSFTEDEPRTIDLSEYVEDEDTPSRDLFVLSGGRYIVMAEGLSVTFLFTDPLSEGTVYFNVSDGDLVTEGSFEVVVAAGPGSPVIDENRDPTMPVVAFAILIAIALIATMEFSKVWLIGLLLPLYMKLHKGDILDQFTRGKIYGYILANPGVHYNSIKRTLDLPNGSFVYHLNLLEGEGFVKSQRDGIYKRYYPSDMRIPKREFSLNESQTQILRIISRTPGISQKSIADILGVSSAAVNYQVEELIHLGFVHKVRRGMSLGYYLNVHE